MLNKCAFIGNLGNDPDIRYTNDGKAIANFSMGVSEKWTNKQGEKQEKTEWIRVTAFGKLAEIIEQYVHKGSKLYVEGKMQTRKWEDKEGNERYTTEIVLDGFSGQMIMLDIKGGGNNSAPAPRPAIDPAAKAAQNAMDDIPF